MKNSIIALLSVVSISAYANQSDVVFPSVENNVAYANVVSLGYKQADEKISYGDDGSQYALLWRANQTKQNKLKPLVVLLHGGCWLSEYDIKHTYALSTALMQAGYNVWSLEYRRSGKSGGGWPVTLNDIKAGILASSSYNHAEFKLAHLPSC